MGPQVQQYLKICLVTGIPNINVLVRRFVIVLEPIVDELVLITGNYPQKDVFNKKIKLFNIRPVKKHLLISRILSFINMQFKYSWILIKNMHCTKVVIFYLEGGGLILPLFIARLARKKTIIVVTHSAELIAKQVEKNIFIPYAYRLLRVISFALANRLIVYSENIFRELELNKYSKKTAIAYMHFINHDIYNISCNISERQNIIGFIGRLSREKGIINLLQAIPLLSQNIKKEFKFIIIGDGELKNYIEDLVENENIKQLVEFKGWMDQKNISYYLNNMKLLVIPSYTEGLVNVMLEAMACGTPVLANSVGAIPDIIKENETGFILKNNLPLSIALGITSAINSPKLNHIATNAYKIIVSDFNYEKAVDNMRKALFN